MREIDYEGGKEKTYSTAGRGERFVDVLARRISRRAMVKGAVAASAIVVTGPALNGSAAAQDATPAATPSGADMGAVLTFQPIAPDAGPEPMVASGYTATTFLSWGDPLTPDGDAFDLATLTAAEQARRFGYNNDFVGFLSLPLGSDNSDHGLLIVNHEYTNPEIMFPGYLQPNPEFDEAAAESDIPEFIVNTSQEIVDIEIEAHGISVVEIRRNATGQWEVVLDSPYNRRVTGATPMTVAGPAAGHDLLKTSADATGASVAGTLNNCAGGLTPWGTYVTCEENFNQYFGNLSALPEGDPVRLLHERIGFPLEGSERQWEEFHSRFDLASEPNEPFRFGWSVEIDPYDAASTPVKRTALGRFKHEAVNLVVTPSGRVAVYSGDDERFDYVYKFVTAGTYNPSDRAANMSLLDDGILSVAVFNDDGTGAWLPLIYGENGLDEANGFASQADILIMPRLAGDILGATKMDRPEDIEHNPVTGKVYMVMTNNTLRGVEDNPGPDAANPRPENAFGHIIEVIEDGGDHAATTFTWDIFLLCGDPADESTYFAGYPKEKVSPIANPDNITFDRDGNLWISTDGQPGSLEINDAVHAVPVEGADRGYLRQFFSAVPGAEAASLFLTPDNTTLFVSVQHPGEGGTFEEPISTWPSDASPARPSMVVVQAENGGRIGS
ncbi:MAG: PhoX family protein [Thermomicrobiales bacterium]